MANASATRADFFDLCKQLGRAILLSAFSFPACALASCLAWVSPTGNDAGSGTRVAPLASIAVAIERCPQGELRLLPGTYRLKDAIAISTSNSGLTIFGADPKSPPTIMGGRSISGFQEFERGIWRAKVDFRFEQLWVNGKRAQRARTPNAGWLYMAGPVGYAKDPRSSAPRDFSRQAFRVSVADAGQIDRMPAGELEDVEVTAWHSWSVSRHRVSSFDRTSGTAFLRTESQWPFFHFGPNQRYQIGNYLAAVDEPGEWFLARDGWLYYFPRLGEDMRHADVVAPVVGKWLVIQGAKNVTLRNLRFEYAGEPLGVAGSTGQQAAAESSAAIIVENSSSIAFEGLRISKTGAYGVWFRQGVHASRITGSVLEDLGAGGVRIGETTNAPGVENSTDGISVERSLIQAGGRENPGAVGILIGHAGNNRLVGNEITDFHYTGISVGWTWGYGKSVATGNLIQGNYVHHIGQGGLSDMGGIYLLGVSPGTVIRGNVIHDVMSYDQYGRGGWGLYADEGTSQVLFEDNLVYRTSSGGFHQHYGRDNLVRHNVFALGRDAQLERTRAENHVSFVFKDNIVVTDGAPMLRGMWADSNLVMDRNIYFDVRERPIDWAGRSFAAWQETGKDRQSAVADPGFRSPADGDFRMLQASLAKKRGFGEIAKANAAARNAGLPRTSRSRVVSWTPVPEPPPPAMELVEGFEVQREGTKPAFAVVSVEGRGDAIAVSRENAHSGAQALKMTDAAGLRHAHDPFFYFRPHHRSGMTSVRFAASFDVQGNFYHEWRDASTPYKVGPSFTVRAGKLAAGGRDLGPVPSGKWIVFSVTAPLGDAPDRQWTLSVEEEGAPARSYSLPFRDAKWTALEWLGFVSNASGEAVTWLDDIEVHNRVE